MNKKSIYKFIVMTIFVCGFINLGTYENALAKDKSLVVSLINKYSKQYNTQFVETLSKKSGEQNKSIEIQNMIYSLDNIKISNSNKDRQPQKENKFLYIDLTVVNKGKEQKGITAVTMFHLTDKDGEIYNLVLPEEQGSLNGLIEKGERIKGTLCFEVPNKLNNFKLEIKPDINSSEVAVLEIDVGKIKKVIKSENTKPNIKPLINSEFNIKDLSITVHSTKVASRNKLKQPTKGNKFVYLDLILENKGKTQAGITAITMFQLIDKKGVKYNLVLPEEQGSLNGVVNSGAKLRGKLCFEVPKNLKEFKLQVKSSFKSSENITLNIKTTS